MTNTVTVNKTTNTVEVQSSGTVGPQGVAGPTGASALVGTGAPASNLGNVNDLYFDNQGFVLYKKTDSTTWTSQGSYATVTGNNTFSTIAVAGQNNVVADTSLDTLTLTAGSNVTITTDDANDAITFASTDTTTNENITVSGDVTGSGTNAISTTLSNSGVSAGTYGSGSLIPSITVDAKGRVTGVTTNSVSSSAGGTVTSVAVSGSDGLQVDSGSPVTTTGTITLGVDASALRTHINVADGAEVNVQSDWNATSGDAEILNKPTVYYTSAIPNATSSQAGLATSAQITKLDGLATVATSGSYNDLSNTPSTDLSADTSPQLGGDLDVNGQDIVTTSNGNIDLDPNGSGKVVFKGNATKGSGQFVLNCENNSHGIIIKGPPHSAGASYTITLPNTDGNSGEFLKTDGSGNTSWDTPAGEVNVQANWNETNSSSDAFIQNKPTLFSEGDAIALAIAL